MLQTVARPLSSHITQSKPQTLDLHKVNTPLQHREQSKFIFPQDAPHVRVRAFLVRRHRVAQDRADAAHPLSLPVHQDLRALRHLLHLRRWGQHLAPLPPRILQPGDRRHDAVLHSRICGRDDDEAGGVAGVRVARAGGGGDHGGKRGEHRDFKFGEFLLESYGMSSLWSMSGGGVRASRGHLPSTRGPGGIASVRVLGHRDTLGTMCEILQIYLCSRV
jgi:hypothetical protein